MDFGDEQGFLDYAYLVFVSYDMWVKAYGIKGGIVIEPSFISVRTPSVLEMLPELLKNQRVAPEVKELIEQIVGLDENRQQLLRRL